MCFSLFAARGEGVALHLIRRERTWMHAHSDVPVFPIISAHACVFVYIRDTLYFEAQ